MLVLLRCDLGRRAQLGLAVARLIVKYLLSEGEPVTVAVDGTFFRRWGKHVAEARWAYDGAAQGGKKIAYGNTWVVAALVVRLRFCPSPVALPVLFRLWRGKGTASQPQLAAQMVKELAEAFPGRAGPRHRGRRVPRGVPGHRGRRRGRRGCRPTRCCTGRSRRPRASGAGPGQKGDRIGTCADAAAARGLARDRHPRLRQGRPRCRSPARDALWYGSFKSAPGQLVLVREPGSAKPYDLGLFTLDTQAPGSRSPSGTPGGGPSSRRTRPGKQLTGAGDACNRVQKAVERTVPFAFLIQSLMIIWYALACDPAAGIGAPPQPLPLVPDQGHALARRHARRAARRAHRRPNFRHQPRSGRLPDKTPTARVTSEAAAA